MISDAFDIFLISLVSDSSILNSRSNCWPKFYQVTNFIPLGFIFVFLLSRPSLMFCPDLLELLLCLSTYIVSHTFLNEKKVNIFKFPY